MNLARRVTLVHDLSSSYVESNFIDIWQAGFGENGNDPATATDFNGDGTIDQNDICCVGAILELPIDEKPPNPRFLKDASGALAATFPRTTFMGHGITTFLRDAGIVGGKRTIELITVTFADATTPDSKPVDEIRAIEISRILGPRGGVIPERLDLSAPGPADLLRSAYGSWNLPASDLAALFTANGYGSMLSPPAGGGTRDGSFLILYEPVSYQDELKEDVLYKVSVPGRPELNRMEANLDMNQQAIRRIEYLDADNLRATGDVVLAEGDRQSGVPTTAGNAFVVGGHMRIESSESHVSATTRYTNPADAILDPVTGVVINDRCKLQGGWRDETGGSAAIDPVAAGPCNVEGGVLTIKGNAILDRLEANGASLSADAVSTPGGLTVSGNAIALSGRFVNMSGTNTLLVNSLNTTNIVTGSGSATTVNAQTVSGGVLNTTAVNINGSTLIAGSLNANSVQATVATAPRATIGGNIGTLTSCMSVVSLLNIPPNIVTAYGLTQWSCMPGTSIAPPP